MSHLVGEFTILGLSVAGFFLACCASCLTCCCCCKCCESVRERIRRLDPRNMMKAQNMNNLPTTDMAALGAVAAGEYMTNREEAGDEARIAAMQGGMPQAPGYAPVPQGYPQGEFPFPQAGTSPYPGVPDLF